MLGLPLTFHMHGHGTLAANMVGHFKMPEAGILKSVQAVATTAAVGTVIVGTDADDNGYLPAFTFGASNVPEVAERGDFTGALNANTAECPYIAKDTVILVTVAHNSMIDCDVTLLFEI